MESPGARWTVYVDDTSPEPMRVRCGGCQQWFGALPGVLSHSWAITNAAVGVQGTATAFACSPKCLAIVQRIGRPEVP